MVLKTSPIKQQRSIYFKNIVGTANVDEGNKIYGYLNAFGNKDSSDDIVLKGSFMKSIAERGPQAATPRKIAFLYMHDMKIPIGKFDVLEERDFGLYYEGTLDMIPFSQETIKPQLKSGTLNQHSIGYNYVWDKIEYDEQKQAFIVKELDLFEGSIVTLGANENTPFGGFKAYLDEVDEFKDMAIKANSIVRKMGNYEAEIELRGILQKYQSLLDHAAEEITAMKQQPKESDLKYIINNFKL